jgi:hypothetical protein
MKNFILVGTQRTGSSALAEIIGFHPDIACGWEWTQHIPRRRKIQAAVQALEGDYSGLLENDQTHMRRIYDQHKTWLGYRRLFRSSDKWLFHPRYAPSLWVDKLEDHLRWLRSRSDIHVIHLRRDDNVAWLKSKYVSKESGRYVGASYPDNVEVTIPLREAVARIKSKMWVDQCLTSLQNSNPFYSVWYEDFSDDKITVAHAIYKFLNCSSHTVSLALDSGRKRQSSGPLSKGVTNYSDLVSKLHDMNLLTTGRGKAART